MFRLAPLKFLPFHVPIIALVSVALNWLPAKAVVVVVQGNMYDVLVTSRSLSNEPSLFTPASMPWFTGDKNDLNLAYDFAQAIGNMLGSNSYPGFTEPGGALFAAAVESGTVYSVFQDLANSGIQYDFSVNTTDSYNFAYVQPATTSAPAPLPLAAVLAGLGWSRRLRQRVSQGDRASAS